ncbi:MAG: hypothetical protein GY835_15550 [bacterium]|nr:hypothetical protein [bacterium]
MRQSTPTLLLIVVCMMFAAVPGSGQIQHDLGSFSATQWTMAHGLPTNVLRGLAQDPDGFLWIATLSGLVRFDGVEFETYDLTNTPELGNSQIGAIQIDGRGRIWVIAHGWGVFVNRSGTFESPLEADYGDAQILATSPAGEILVGTSLGLVRFVEGDSFTFSPVGSVGNILFDNRGYCWLTLSSSGVDPRCEILCLDNGGECLRGEIPFAEGLKLSPWNDDGVIVHTPDSLIFATAEGILSHPVEQAVAPDLLRRMLDSSGEWIPHDVMEDRQGRTWICSDQGLFMTPVAPFAPHAPRTSAAVTMLSAAEVGTIRTTFQDRDGDLWVGTEVKGMFRLSPTITSPISEPPAWNTAGTMIRREHHVPWLFSLSAADESVTMCLRNLEGSDVATFRDLGSTIRLIRSAPPSAGALLYNDESLFLYKDRELLELEPADPDWPAGFFAELPGGEFCYDLGSAVVLASASGMDSLTFAGRIIGKTPDQACWYQAGDQLFRHLEDTTDSFGPAEGLPPGFIRDIWQDPQGRLWLALHGSGLACLVDGHFRVATIRNGLPENTVGGMLADDHGNLWVNSNRGLFVVAISALDRFARAESDYLPCRLVTRVESGSFWAARGLDGRLYFDTLTGYVAVEPDKLPGATAPPPARVNAIRIGNRRLERSSEMRLPQGERDFSISYTAPNLRDAEQIRFRYRVRALSEDWIDVGKRREVFITHFPPGVHQFELQAANASGEWALSGDDITIIVPHYYHETIWFRLSLFGLVIGILAIAHRRRVRRRELHLCEVEAESTRRLQAEKSLRKMGRRLLSAQEDERRRVAGELHDDINQRVSMLAMELDMMALGRSRAPEDLALDAQALSADLHLMSHNLHPGRIEQIGLVGALERLCLESNRVGEQTIEFKAVSVPEALPKPLALCLYRIAQEAIRNAQKYSGGKEIRVTLFKVGEDLILAIADKGDGFNVEMKTSEGLGLLSMTERVAAAGGELAIESWEGKGTTIRATIPLNEEDPDG